jgi:hypothetical protein
MSEELRGTFEEWRVTGVMDYEPYAFTWSPALNPHLGDPETSARAFLDTTASYVGWSDGPHLQRRFVTLGVWQEMPL